MFNNRHDCYLDFGLQLRKVGSDYNAMDLDN